MNLQSPRLDLKLQHKQLLTPSLLQMVTFLQLNRLELKEMINQELVANPVLEESLDGPSDEATPEELLELAGAERVSSPSDENLLAAVNEIVQENSQPPDETTGSGSDSSLLPAGDAASSEEPAASTTDTFDEIDFGSFFDDYLDPGYKTPAAEASEKPTYELFLSAPVTLYDYLRSQLSILVLAPEVRSAAEAIVGNLEEDGYLTMPFDEVFGGDDYSPETIAQALKVVQSLDPAGVGARDLRECLLLQLESRSGRGGVAWEIVDLHLDLLKTRQFKQLAKVTHRPPEHIEIAVNVIRHLNPQPGLRYSGKPARTIEPDVYITRDGESFVLRLNDEDIPDLRLNQQYRRMLDQGSDKEARNYIKERFNSAIQLIRNIEQRKQTILRVCECVIRRQGEFFTHGVEHLKPMMIKEVAEEVGVNPSTVSRAVANKYVHTPLGVFELRYFFSEAVQGPMGGDVPLTVLKRTVKKMIDEEDRAHPLTDEQIKDKLITQGINVTRRTVAKYREDLKIPSTHLRRQRE